MVILLFVFRTNSCSSFFWGAIFFSFILFLFVPPYLFLFFLFIFQFSLIIFILVFCTFVFFFFYLFFFVSTFCPFSILKKKKISFPILPTKLGPETGDTRSPRSYIHEIVSLQEVSNATAQNVPTKQFCLNSCIFAIFKNKMNRFRFLSSSKRVNNISRKFELILLKNSGNILFLDKVIDFWFQYVQN